MTGPAQPPATMPPEILHLRKLLAEDPTHGASATGAWDAAWRSDVTPWDSRLKDVQPSLRELVESEFWHERVEPGLREIGGRVRALVAGCGRGYDAIYFALQGIDSVGIDLSPTAVRAANDHLESLGANAPKNVEFRAADFFDFSLDQDDSIRRDDDDEDRDGEGRLFSLAYDFTFFCAIPPASRRMWGERYAALIRRGGVLITLEYPIDGDRQGGPPFSVSPEAYDQVLSPNFDKMYDQVPTKQTAGHEGRERIVVWKRK
ncbi:hypothetical protein JCM3766R1_003129 [Sporobolomyces carnicolor]